MIDHTSLMLEKVSHFLTKKIVKQINKLADIDRVPFETYLEIKEFVAKHLIAKSASVAMVNKPMCLQDVVVDGVGYYRIFLFNALDDSVTVHVGDFSEKFPQHKKKLPTQSEDSYMHTPVEEWLHVLLDKYRKLILLEYKEPNESNPNYAKLTKDHLFWMCDELVKYTDTGKRHRWLGYIHGVLVMNGCIIAEVINYTTQELHKNSLTNLEVTTNPCE